VLQVSSAQTSLDGALAGAQTLTAVIGAAVQRANLAVALGLDGALLAAPLVLASLDAVIGDAFGPGAGRTFKVPATKAFDDFVGQMESIAAKLDNIFESADQVAGRMEELSKLGPHLLLMQNGGGGTLGNGGAASPGSLGKAVGESAFGAGEAGAGAAIMGAPVWPAVVIYLTGTLAPKVIDELIFNGTPPGMSNEDLEEKVKGFSELIQSIEENNPISNLDKEIIETWKAERQIFIDELNRRQSGVAGPQGLAAITLLPPGLLEDLAAFQRAIQEITSTLDESLKRVGAPGEIQQGPGRGAADDSGALPDLLNDLTARLEDVLRDKLACLCDGSSEPVGKSGGGPSGLGSSRFDEIEARLEGKLREVERDIEKIHELFKDFPKGRSQRPALEKLLEGAEKERDELIDDLEQSRVGGQTPGTLPFPRSKPQPPAELRSDLGDEASGLRVTKLQGTLDGFEVKLSAATKGLGTFGAGLAALESAMEPAPGAGTATPRIAVPGTPIPAVTTEPLAAMPVPLTPGSLMPEKSSGSWTTIWTCATRPP
jgi:hypothetical protein